MPEASLAEYLNSLSEENCHRQLERCCAARWWIDGMLGRRPFAADHRVHAAAREVWWSLGESSWREAFAAHPAIGDVHLLRAQYRATHAWARDEQATAAGADETTLQRLAELNAAYLAKFGYLFIVCATDKTAGEILGILESRLHNPPEVEIHAAASEQLLITILRLRKLVA